MNFKNTLAIAFVLILTCTAVSAQNLVETGFKKAEAQTNLMLAEIIKARHRDSTGVSPRTLSDGQLKLVPSKDWCSGFFPGELWLLYRHTNNAKWLKLAEAYTLRLETEKNNGTTHDMGFKIYCSFGTGYAITANKHYKTVIIEAAKTLATRYSAKVDAIKSWDKKEWKFPVIIDNMMNLELLFEASKLSGDSTFYKIAVSHANTTLKNHFRPNYSSYHLVSYDPETGEVIKKQTHQGYADESAWARGQSWALYGYTMCYRETGNKLYLQQAENVAKYILQNPNLPSDLVPYWDYNAPNIPNEPRDASAAAIVASALYELSGYSQARIKYLKKADAIMESLTQKYMANAGSNKGFVLLHSTGSKPANSEIDVPLSYADYYYMEALTRKYNLEKGKPAIALSPR
ncbi:glycosyl hydrolase family 88 [Mucilaginibacter gracilis]|uniref:Glycosyl hydrolase family 88 n=1 Tax=Mucilaginibacter gracilis TaxID=423350 RepID=A0A495J511_9SPHI|nr:glycoside hydrolase family 88 protein [Mucilaginibacter gracilis]RKR83702.1 glycosyl hydrolase family 88 [Mucilaginibacter gracilis]